MRQIAGPYRQRVVAFIAFFGVIALLGGCLSRNQLPIAAFTFTPSAPVAGSLVSFDASASTDPDGTIMQYAWDFGDGTSGSGASASHTYGTTGTYTATLTVSDDDGASDSVSLGVTVSAPQPGNQPPTAAFTPSPLWPAAGTEVSFDASASTDPDGTIVQYAWNFGDETTGSGVNTTHVFQNDTDQIIPYTVTLTVTDDDGATDSTSIEIQVAPGLPPLP